MCILGSATLPADLSKRLSSAHVVREAIDERALADLRRMRRLVRNENYDETIVLCKDLSTLRYPFFLKFYLVIGKSGHRTLVDEQGNSQSVRWILFLFLDVPIFLIELLAGACVVLWAWLRLLPKPHSHKEESR